MSVELYFVKRDDGEAIEFPCWAPDGDEPLPHHTYICISSLKWAMGEDRLIDAGLLREPLTPRELVDGATAALRSLLNDYLALHDDFRALPGADATEPDVVSEVITQFEMAGVGGDEATLMTVAELVNQTSHFHHLFVRMLAAGRDGYHGYWSY